MGHTPYGYSIENGCATIKDDEAGKIRKLYENYISGMALAKAAAAAGIETYHGTAKRLMENRHYLGDDFYPAIIDQETFDEAAAIRLERAGKLGRLNRKKNSKTVSALCCCETANRAFKLIFTPYNGTNLGIALPSA
jgi:hypothetical protein